MQARRVDDVQKPETVSQDARDRLVRLAYRFAWNREDAEDAVQEALVECERHRGQLRDPARWWAWVRRIVVQQCHLLGRRTAARRSLETRLAEYRATQDVVPSASDEGDSLEMIRMLIADLPDRQREVIVLRHLEGLEVAEIADVLGITESTVRVQTRNGRETLRRLMLERHPDWAGRGSDAAETRSP